MHEAAQFLLGETGFFIVSCCGVSVSHPFRNVHFIHVKRHGLVVEIEIKTNAFLHHMVRNIAGVLMAVGQGTSLWEWVDSVLQARDRRQGGVGFITGFIWWMWIIRKNSVYQNCLLPLLYVISNTHWKPSFNKLACVLVSLCFEPE